MLPLPIGIGLAVSVIAIIFINQQQFKPLTEEQKRKKNDDYKIAKKLERKEAKQQMLKTLQKQYVGDNPEQNKTFFSDEAVKQRQERVLSRFTPEQRKQFMSNMDKVREKMDQRLEEGSDYEDENVKPIDEDETLGFWVNRAILTVIVLFIYQIGINLGQLPTYAKLFEIIKTKVEVAFSNESPDL